MNNTKMALSDVRSGDEYMCIYNGDEEDESYRVGELYTLTTTGLFPVVGHEKGVYYRLEYAKDRGCSGEAEMWTRCVWDNGETWLEIIPVSRLTDEDMFTIKMGGPEMVFGERTTNAGGQ